MKIFLQILSMMCACNFLASCGTKQAPPQTTVEIQDVGGDQTDIFAIPLDTSEFEEAQEMDTLQSLETPAKAQAPQAPSPASQDPFRR